MLKETIARRYSAALFAVAKRAGTVDSVAKELDAIVSALSSDSRLAEFFSSPVIDRAAKTKLLQAALEGRASEVVNNFIIILVRKRRENLIGTIARQMHELLDQEAGRSPAEISTPVALAPDALAELARRLSNIYKRTVVPEPRIAPELLGGAVVQVGDRYVDGSVSGKLEEVRRHLLEGLDRWVATSPNGKQQQ